MNHPCDGCPSTAYHGRIACPVAMAAINKHRCQRVRRMAPASAYGNLNRSAMAQWEEAKATGDKHVIRWLDFAGRHPIRFRQWLAERDGGQQIAGMDPRSLVIRWNPREVGLTATTLGVTSGGASTDALGLVTSPGDPRAADGLGKANGANGRAAKTGDGHSGFRPTPVAIPCGIDTIGWLPPAMPKPDGPQKS